MNMSSLENTAASPLRRVREVAFLRDKYGPELLVDAGWIRDLERFNSDDTPHRLHFYDVLLVTGGAGRVLLDGASGEVGPGRLVFTSPGQVRRFLVRDLEGICLFFPGEFVEDFFRDPLFLARLHLFRHAGAEEDASFPISEERGAWLVERLEAMRRELACLRGDSSHLLRAILYEVLVTVHRWIAEEKGTSADTRAHPTVYRFLDRLERTFAREHQVAAYARELGVTPGHLSVLTRRAFGRSAGRLIRDRLAAEARRLLLCSDRPVAEVGREIGFEDPSYFVRFFRRETARTPKAFRDAALASLR